MPSSISGLSRLAQQNNAPKSENWVYLSIGAVHKVRHAIFWPILTPLPSVTLVTPLGTPLKYVTHLRPHPHFS